MTITWRSIGSVNSYCDNNSECACLIYVNCVCLCLMVSNVHCVFLYVLFHLVYLKLTISLDFHFWIALWCSLTFSYRRLTFFPICISTPTCSANHKKLASIVWHTSLMLLHFNTVATTFNGEGGYLSLNILEDRCFSVCPFSCPSSSRCIVCPSSIYGLQLPFDIFLLLHMYDLLYL